jgi:hypothetical protein
MGLEVPILGHLLGGVCIHRRDQGRSGASGGYDEWQNG